jgi:hypothetical protein
MNTPTFLSGSFQVRQLFGQVEEGMVVDSVLLVVIVSKDSFGYESAYSSSRYRGGFQWVTRCWFVTSVTVSVAVQQLGCNSVHPMGNTSGIVREVALRQGEAVRRRLVLGYHGG